MFAQVLNYSARREGALGQPEEAVPQRLRRLAGYFRSLAAHGHHLAHERRLLYGHRAERAHDARAQLLPHTARIVLPGAGARGVLEKQFEVVVGFWVFVFLVLLLHVQRAQVVGQPFVERSRKLSNTMDHTLPPLEASAGTQGDTGAICERDAGAILPCPPAIRGYRLSPVTKSPVGNAV